VLLAGVLAAACVSSGAGARAGSSVGAGAATERIATQVGATDVMVSRTDDVRTAELPASRAQVLGALPGVYGDLELPLLTIDPQGGVVGAVSARVFRSLGKVPLSRVVDCGTGAMGRPNADTYNVQLTTLTRVTSVDSAHSMISTQVRGVSRAVSTSGQDVPCSSTGWAESQIEKGLRARLQR
jgi:hypothetical protein